MLTEFLNVHTHNAGFLHRDWQFSTDRSVDLALEQLRLAARDGLSADDVLQFIKSGLDFGQITDREARQLSAALRARYDQMSPDAKRIAERFDQVLQEKLPDVHDSSHEKLSGYEHQAGWFGTNFRTNFPDEAVLEGKELDNLVGGLEREAHPLPAFAAAHGRVPDVFQAPLAVIRG